MKIRAMFLTLLLAAGCGQKFNKEFSYAMSPQENRYLEVDPPRVEQKVEVALETGGVPVDVFVVLADSVASAQQALRNPTSPSIVARMAQVPNPKVEAIIPAGKGYVVAISNTSNQPATVKGKIAGR